MIVVSNSTPIISLATVGRIVLLESLFGRVYIPREIERELKDNQYPGHDDIDQSWCNTKDVQGTLYVGFLCHDLDRGKGESITLAKLIQIGRPVSDKNVLYGADVKPSLFLS